MLVPVKVYGNWSSNIRKWYPHICGLGLAVNIRQKKKQTHFLSFIMAAETNPRVDPATLLQLHIIRKLDEVILMLSESRTQHDSVDYTAYININERRLHKLDGKGGSRSFDQPNWWENLKNIINNQMLPKAVNFVYIGNVNRPLYDIPKEWLPSCLE